MRPFAQFPWLQRNIDKFKSTEKDVEIRTERSLNEYFKDRVERKILRYEQKAKGFKWLYWTLAVVGAVCAAIVPAIIHEEPVAATAVSLVVTIVVALQGIFHPREHWRNYDLITSALRQEEMLFSTSTGDYATQPDPAKRFKLLVQRVEALIAKERAETITMRTGTPPSTAVDDNGNRKNKDNQEAPNND